MEDSKELIIKYFFIEHLKVKEIAEIVHTSSSYITKIIKQDERYSEEKKYRCNKSKEKRKKDQNRFIKHKREQKRIDEAYKKITSYCKKPDWFKVKSRNENLLSGDITYWDRRQSEFFETANDCIKRYSGSNLAACFKDLNDTQEHLDATLAAEQARREEAEQREIQIRQLVRQNMLLEEQNLIQWSRYNSFYPRYYRHPYWCSASEKIFYNSCNAIAGVWLAVASRVALACCNIWFLI